MPETLLDDLGVDYGLAQQPAGRVSECVERDAVERRLLDRGVEHARPEVRVPDWPTLGCLKDVLPGVFPPRACEMSGQDSR